jgi:hypothetical protein
MKPKDFFSKYNGKGIDFDGFYGFQCMDLYQQFNKEVVGGIVVHGNAIDMWTAYPKASYIQIKNEPTNFPQEGDVVIWGQGVGQYGHIAVCSTANANAFVSFDQNWPVGSKCHFQNHSFKYVLGWLRPNKFQPVAQPPIPVQPQVETPPVVVEPPVVAPEPPEPVQPPEVLIHTGNDVTPVSELPTEPNVIPVEQPKLNFFQRLIEFFSKLLGK